MSVEENAPGGTTRPMRSEPPLMKPIRAFAEYLKASAARLPNSFSRVRAAVRVQSTARVSPMIGLPIFSAAAISRCAARPIASTSGTPRVSGVTRSSVHDDFSATRPPSSTVTSKRPAYRPSRPACPTSVEFAPLSMIIFSSTASCVWPPTITSMPRASAASFLSSGRPMWFIATTASAPAARSSRTYLSATAASSASTPKPSGKLTTDFSSGVTRPNTPSFTPPRSIIALFAKYRPTARSSSNSMFEARTGNFSFGPSFASVFTPPSKSWLPSTPASKPSSASAPYSASPAVSAPLRPSITSPASKRNTGAPDSASIFARSARTSSSARAMPPV